MARATLGVIVGNRDFFPDALVTEARADVLALFEEMDIESVILDEQVTSCQDTTHAQFYLALLAQDYLVELLP